VDSGIVIKLLKRRATIVVLFVAMMLTVLVSAQTAYACSYSPIPPEGAIQQGDGAFVGKLISSRPNGGGGFENVTYTFLVEWVVKGSIGRRVEVVSGRGGGDCGLGDQLSDRVGLVVERKEGRWSSWIGALYEPQALLAVANEPRFLGPLGDFEPIVEVARTPSLYLLLIVVPLLAFGYQLRGHLRSRRRRPVGVQGK
jgi:hypothetical protein